MEDLFVASFLVTYISHMISVSQWDVERRDGANLHQKLESPVCWLSFTVRLTGGHLAVILLALVCGKNTWGQRERARGNGQLIKVSSALQHL